jgi:hypothetical protein
MGDNISISKFSNLLLLRASERFKENKIAPRLQSTLTELVKLAEHCELDAEIAARTPILTTILKLMFLIAGSIFFLNYRSQIWSVFDTQNKGLLIQIIESASNLVLVTGAAILSLLSLDKKLRRRKLRSRTALIRSIINTIALLQLEKDPSRLSRDKSQNTAHSPQLNFTALELDCYFEYSIEALEICSAILSTYAKVLDDAVLLEEISDLQELASAKQDMISRRRERLQNIVK